MIDIVSKLHESTVIGENQLTLLYYIVIYYYLIILCILLFTYCIFKGPFHRIVNGLTYYHIMPNFDALKIYSCGKHCEKRRNCLEQAISSFLTMFSTLYGTYFSFQVHFGMSSAICFNLDQSKILSSGNESKDEF